MSKKTTVILYGAGGHGKVVADSIEKQKNLRIAGFLDDKKTGECFGYPILGGRDLLRELRSSDIQTAIVTIGDAAMRKEIQEYLLRHGFLLATAVHPSAKVARGAALGEGTVVMAGAVIGPDATIGQGCVINTRASVDHDCVLGDFVQVAPNACVGGNVSIGEGTFIGIGASIRDNVSIGGWTTVGMGAVVVSDTPSKTTVLGIPARPVALPITRPSLPSFHEIAGEIEKTLQSGMIRTSTYVKRLEASIAELLGVRHAVCVSSGTTGLMLLIRSLGLKGEILMPSFTFMATPLAAVWNGCTPVFADIDPQTMVIDPDQIEKLITTQTSGILAVHTFGNPAPIEELEKIARTHGLPLIFDAAHALGTTWRGKPVGGFGNAEVFSLSPTKIISAAEGGIVCTPDDLLAEKIRMGRHFGDNGKGECVLPGLNGHMSEFSAILGHANLQRMDQYITQRTVLASLYRERLGGLPGISFQHIDKQNQSTFKDIVIQIDEKEFGVSRSALGEKLKEHNIETRTYFDPPCHRMAAFAKFHNASRPLPATEALAAQCLSLPLWSTMEPERVEEVCQTIRSIHKRTICAPRK